MFSIPRLRGQLEVYIDLYMYNALNETHDVRHHLRFFGVAEQQMVSSTDVGWYKFYRPSKHSCRGKKTGLKFLHYHTLLGIILVTKKSTFNIPTLPGVIYDSLCVNAVEAS
jgi:hypothetical protein